MIAQDVRDHLPDAVVQVVPGRNAGYALEELLRGGANEVFILPFCLFRGMEYERVNQAAAPFFNRFTMCRVSAPLLASEQDVVRAADAITNAYAPCQPGEALVLVGHGTGHEAGAAYGQMERRFQKNSAAQILVSTLQNKQGFAETIKRLNANGIQQVQLAPFMLATGTHSELELFGDSPDSWKSVLEQNGFSVASHRKGLAAIPKIRTLFLEHLREIRTD